MLERAIKITDLLEKNKVVIIYGTRQVGKTTLVNEFLAETKLPYKFFSGDQLGDEVSTTELGSKLGLDHKTVIRYLELLEKSFVIFRVTGFARNLRKEINKMGKYYFYALGIRNALIANFNALDSRNDLGQLWENFLVIERIKRNAYKKLATNYYFWRTYDQKEIDFVESV